MRGRKHNHRGGGHRFSRNLAPLQYDEDGNLVQDEPEKEAKKTTKSRRKEGDESGSGSGSDDDSSESSGESESGSGSDSESSDGEARPATKAPSGTASVIQVSNPNREKKSMKLSDLGKPVGGGDDDMFRKDGQMSRREREAAEKERAKEAYWKAHLAGQTEQARADLARLALIKKQREEAAQRREAESKAKETARTASKSTSLASNKAIVTARVGSLGKDEPAAAAPRSASTAGAANRGGKTAAPAPAGKGRN